MSSDSLNQKNSKYVCSECGEDFTKDKMGNVATSVKNMCCLVSFSQGNARLIK